MKLNQYHLCTAWFVCSAFLLRVFFLLLSRSSNRLLFPSGASVCYRFFFFFFCINGEQASTIRKYWRGSELLALLSIKWLFFMILFRPSSYLVPVDLLYDWCWYWQLLTGGIARRSMLGHPFFLSLFSQTISFGIQFGRFTFTPHLIVVGSGVIENGAHHVKNCKLQQCVLVVLHFPFSTYRNTKNTHTPKCPRA